MNKKIWAQNGSSLYLGSPSTGHEKLGSLIYTVGLDMFGRFFLSPVAKSYDFDYKIYDLQTNLVNRVVKTYTKQDGNLGVLLNGSKGTGKTVTAKIMCNKLNLPVIVVNKRYEKAQVHMFLNSIPQDIIIFIDEYEKVFQKSNEMLTIMDGALNSVHRRVFMLTTNKLYIEDNLKQRPGRLRYMKTFEDLEPSVVEEIVDDVLEHKQFRQDCITFISSLSLITVDIVKSILNEVNMHQEAPEAFADVFNVKKLEGYHKIVDITDGGSEVSMDTAVVEPSPTFNIHNEGNYFRINGSNVGTVVKVLGPETIKVAVWLDDDMLGTGKEMILRIHKSFGTHSSYMWGDNGENENRIKSSEKFAKKIEVLQGEGKSKMPSRSGSRGSLIGEKLAELVEPNDIIMQEYEEDGDVMEPESEG